MVDEYYRILGGRPQAPEKAQAKGPGRKRKSVGEAKATPEKSEPKRRRKSKVEATPEGDELSDWLPKGKSWESDVSRVDTIIRDQESEKLFVYLNWKNGKKTRVSIETTYEKCPQKVCLPMPFYTCVLTFR